MDGITDLPFLVNLFPEKKGKHINISWGSLQPCHSVIEEDMGWFEIAYSYIDLASSQGWASSGLSGSDLRSDRFEKDGGLHIRGEHPLSLVGDASLSDGGAASSLSCLNASLTRRPFG